MHGLAIAGSARTTTTMPAVTTTATSLHLLTPPLLILTLVLLLGGCAGGGDSAAAAVAMTMMAKKNWTVVAFHANSYGGSPDDPIAQYDWAKVSTYIPAWTRCKVGETIVMKSYDAVLGDCCVSLIDRRSPLC